jgi:site-specific recombinase XerD
MHTRSALTLKSQAAPVTPTTLERAFADFLRLDVAEGDASPETIRAYTGQLQAFLAWCEAERIHPALATFDDLKAYRKALVEAGYARSTIAAKLNAVRRFYTMAKAHGYRPDDPAAGLKPPPDRTSPADRRKWLPLQAIARLLEAPDASTIQGKRDRAIIALMATCGLRVSDVAHLDVADVDLENHRLSVLGKGKKLRTIPLEPESAAILADWLAVRGQAAQEDETALLISLHHPDPGTRMSRRAISCRVDGYLMALDLKRVGISCHALRHSFATLSLAAGARIHVLQKVLGHASVSTTGIYSDIVEAEAENPARFLFGALQAISAPGA